MLNRIYEIATIILLIVAAEALAKIVPIPSSLLGMFLFFILLLFRVLKEENYKISSFLLQNLSFFFIPSGVRIIENVDLLKGNLGKMIVIMTISNVLIMGVTAMVTQFLLLKGAKHESE